MARLREALQIPGGRRAKFAVIGVWLLIAIAIGPLSGKFEDVQKNDPVDYLPGSAESVKALQKVKKLPDGETANAITVFHRGGGLTAADRGAIDRTRSAINGQRRAGVGATGPAVVSKDGGTALLTTPIKTKDGSSEASDLLVDTTDDIKDDLGSLPGGLQAKVTGPAGFSADAINVYKGINGTLLLATAGLVLLLLIAIYRSPVFWMIPFFTVLLAEVSSRGIGYLLAEAGVTINGQSGSILPILVFGAGTDYALLMVSRYREELRRHEDKHDAIRVALRRTGPVVAASGATVMAALLTLSFAELNGTSGLGPIGAMGIALAMISMLTLLPALLTVFGRRAFWPFIPRLGTEGSDETHGAWRRVAEWVSRGPRRVWIGTVGVLAVLALGLTQLNTDLTSGNMFRNDVDSVQGQRLLAKGFPAGANAPTDVIVTDTPRLGQVRSALRKASGVTRVRETEQGAAGIRLEATLDRDPQSTAAFDLIPGIRKAVHSVAGNGAVVGGSSAQEYDVRKAAARDNRVIVPIALLVVFLILAALLRAIVAPLVLIGTVVASYAAAMGIGAFFSEQVFGFPGIDPSMPLFAFVFLVALGIDYNIFLMARVREETLSHGTRNGTIRGLAVTGAVITSAGLVLAGTFSTLAVLPLVALTEIGFTVAVGVLIDTFLVRSLLVPALVLEIGNRVWWPSALAGTAARRRRERASGQPAFEAE